MTDNASGRRISRRQVARAAAVVAPVTAVAALGAGEAQASVPTSWQTTGDAGTSSGTNFVGTTDDVALVLRTGNAEAMRLTATQEVGIGTTAPAARVHVATSSGAAILGASGGTTPNVTAVAGTTSSTSAGAIAVQGVLSASAPGTGAIAVSGQVASTGSTGTAVSGAHSGGGVGVAASSVSGPAVMATSGSGPAIVAAATGTSAAGVITATSPATANNVSVVSGTLSASELGTGCAAVSAHVSTTGGNGTAILGVHAGSGNGVSGTSVGGTGVNAASDTGPAVVASSMSGLGALVSSGGPIGLQVASSGSSIGYALIGTVSSASANAGSTGVVGVNSASHSTAVGVTGIAQAGAGVVGSSSTAAGIGAESTTGSAIVASVTGSSSLSAAVTASSTIGPGITVTSASGTAVIGTTTTASPSGSQTAGVAGFATGNSAQCTAISGTHDYDGIGLIAQALDLDHKSGAQSSAVALMATTPYGTALLLASYTGDSISVTSSSGDAVYASVTPTVVNGQDTYPGYWAGFFDGYVYTNGSFTSGGITQQAVATTLIDDPRDPAGQLVALAGVEAPEMLTLHRGVVSLDGTGSADVSVPGWSDLIGSDVSYLLSPFGAAMPDLHVANEITDGMFTVAGGTPTGVVSWQVSATRADPFAAAHPLVVEQPKTAGDLGRYLHPALFGRGSDEAMLRLAAPTAALTRTRRTPSETPDA